MSQQQQSTLPKRSIKYTIYRLARLICIIAVWVWTTVIIVFLLQLIPSLLTFSEPGTLFRTTWAFATMTWLLTPNQNPFLEFLRVVVPYVAIIFLIVLPLVALLLRQTLQRYASPEGFEKLIQVLQQDRIPTQLDELCEMLQDHYTGQIERQERLISGLSQISSQQKTPLCHTCNGCRQRLSSNLACRKGSPRR